MDTGENAQGIRAILDFLRKGSIVVLILHFYVLCYLAFVGFGLTHPVVERILLNLGKTGLFNTPHTAKVFAIGLLILSLVGTKGKKDEKAKISKIIGSLVIGFLLYFGSTLLFDLTFSPAALAVSYILTTSAGFLLILAGGSRLSRLIKVRLKNDIFNEQNQSFPQEERLLNNEFSVNLPATYKLKGKTRRMWINVINPFRATLIIGSPGAGKSYFVVRHFIQQHIRKGFTLFLYDFKFDDLTKIAYNTLLRCKSSYKKPVGFYVINFDDLSLTHRCNPLEPDGMVDITDAAESARTILLGLNRDWIKKQGEFFTESAINFVTAVMWFLRKYRNGVFCTLPHLIELMQVDYNSLFPVLSTESEIEVLINPFISAYMNRALEQLEGQVASAKIAMARLSSPQLYYVLTGNDFTLDVNNPEHPKIICAGNNPLKVQTYGAVLSLYISRVSKLVTRKNMEKCAIICDEFPTLYWNGIENLIAVARSYKVATTLAIQDYSQLKKDYSREQAEVIMNIAGNMISGQAVGDTAKLISDRIGKIVQERESVSINRNDTSVSKSTQLDYAVPPSKVSALSSGEFVGMVADNPTEKIKYKAFHCEIQNDHAAIKAEENNYKSLPKVRQVTHIEVINNYIKIKNDVAELVETELERIKNDPDLSHLLFVQASPPGNPIR